MEVFRHNKNLLYDKLYQVFSHYSLIQAKLDHQVILHPYKLEAIFDNYIIDLMALRETLLPPKEVIVGKLFEVLAQDFEEKSDSFKHLSTEKAFSLLEQIKAIDLILKQTDSFLKENERNAIVNSIMKPIHLAI